jgi:riboflavin synthase
VFSGIVAAVGKVKAATPNAGGLRLSVDAGALDLGDVAVGDSVAVNGVCLTVVARNAGGFDADVSRETLGCTAGFPAGASINLEKALRLSDRLGGHLVSGHVDGIGAVARIDAEGGNRLIAFTAPSELAKYIACKGSIAVNGVSLTVNEVNGAEFGVNLIPHTLAASNLGDLKTGDRVNIEVDLMARYLERLSEASSSIPPVERLKSGR